MKNINITREMRRYIHANLHLCISDGNRKMGRIGNISLPPILSCRKCGLPCRGVCYAMNDYTQYTATFDGWNRNWLKFEADIVGYFNDIIKYLENDIRIGFRWHVGGDIPSEEYFEWMLYIANLFPNKQFLAFTKQYEIVNNVLDRLEKPSNLNVIFSPWEGLEMPNPHNLPIAVFIPMGMEDTIQKDWKVCEGNCQYCLSHGEGCFYTHEGYVVAMKEHGTPRTKAKKRVENKHKNK